jgi:RimJ/RimL family protein N-acetyltransferase
VNTIDPEAWPAAEVIDTVRLRLEPLRVGHAAQAVTVFGDPRLHEWIGGQPASAAELEERYRRQSAGHSPDGTQGWLNWMLRCLSDDQLVGTVQATLSRPGPRRLTAELAWVVGIDYQNKGYAREGALAVSNWLKACGATELVAHIHPGNDASIAVARSLGLTATGVMHDGEILWSGAAS